MHALGAQLRRRRGRGQDRAQPGLEGRRRPQGQVPHRLPARRQRQPDPQARCRWQAHARQQRQPALRARVRSRRPAQGPGTGNRRSQEELGNPAGAGGCAGSVAAGAVGRGRGHQWRPERERPHRRAHRRGGHAPADLQRRLEELPLRQGPGPRGVPLRRRQCRRVRAQWRHVHPCRHRDRHRAGSERRHQDHHRHPPQGRPRPGGSHRLRLQPGPGGDRRHRPAQPGPGLVQPAHAQGGAGQGDQAARGQLQQLVQRRQLHPVEDEGAA